MTKDDTKKRKPAGHGKKKSSPAKSKKKGGRPGMEPLGTVESISAKTGKIKPWK